MARPIPVNIQNDVGLPQVPFPQNGVPQIPFQPFYPQINPVIQELSRLFRTLPLRLRILFFNLAYNLSRLIDNTPLYQDRGALISQGLEVCRQQHPQEIHRLISNFALGVDPVVDMLSVRHLTGIGVDTFRNLPMMNQLLLLMQFSLLLDGQQRFMPLGTHQEQFQWSLIQQGVIAGIRQLNCLMTRNIPVVPLPPLQYVAEPRVAYNRKQAVESRKSVNQEYLRQVEGIDADVAVCNQNRDPLHTTYQIAQHEVEGEAENAKFEQTASDHANLQILLNRIGAEDVLVTSSPQYAPDAERVVQGKDQEHPVVLANPVTQEKSREKDPVLNVDEGIHNNVIFEDRLQNLNQMDHPDVQEKLENSPAPQAVNQQTEPQELVNQMKTENVQVVTLPQYAPEQNVVEIKTIQRRDREQLDMLDNPVNQVEHREDTTVNVTVGSHADDVKRGDDLPTANQVAFIEDHRGLENSEDRQAVEEHAEPHDLVGHSLDKHILTVGEDVEEQGAVLRPLDMVNNGKDVVDVGVQVPGDVAMGEFSENGNLRCAHNEQSSARGRKKQENIERALSIQPEYNYNEPMLCNFQLFLPHGRRHRQWFHGNVTSFSLNVFFIENRVLEFRSSIKNDFSQSTESPLFELVQQSSKPVISQYDHENVWMCNMNIKMEGAVNYSQSSPFFGTLGNETNMNILQIELAHQELIIDFGSQKGQSSGWAKCFDSYLIGDSSSDLTIRIEILPVETKGEIPVSEEASQIVQPQRNERSTSPLPLIEGASPEVSNADHSVCVVPNNNGVLSDDHQQTAGSSTVSSVITRSNVISPQRATKPRQKFKPPPLVLSNVEQFVDFDLTSPLAIIYENPFGRSPEPDFADPNYQCTSSSLPKSSLEDEDEAEFNCDYLPRKLTRGKRNRKDSDTSNLDSATSVSFSSPRQLAKKSAVKDNFRKRVNCSEKQQKTSLEQKKSPKRGHTTQTSDKDDYHLYNSGEPKIKNPKKERLASNVIEKKKLQNSSKGEEPVIKESREQKRRTETGKPEKVYKKIAMDKSDNTKSKKKLMKKASSKKTREDTDDESEAETEEVEMMEDNVRSDEESEKSSDSESDGEEERLPCGVWNTHCLTKEYKGLLHVVRCDECRQQWHTFCLRLQNRRWPGVTFTCCGARPNLAASDARGGIIARRYRAHKLFIEDAHKRNIRNCIWNPPLI